MEIHKDFQYFGYYCKNALEAHSKGELSDEKLIEYLKSELEIVKKVNE